jgi:hypothetical protein
MIPPPSLTAALWVGALAAIAGFSWTVGCWIAGRLLGGRAPH